MKKRYLCPVCDQELTAKSYCPECRRIRREPVIYEGWLLPNESDHDGTSGQAADPGTAEQVRPRAQAGKPPAPGRGEVSGKQVLSGGRVYDSRYLDTCKSSHEHTYGVPGRDPHKKKRDAEPGTAGRSFNGLKVALVLSVIVISVAALWESVWNVAGEMIADIQEEFGIGDSRDDSGAVLEDAGIGEDSGVISGNGSTDNYKTLSEEEVKAAGEPCNGYTHYNVDGEEYLARLSGYMGSLWPEESCDFEWQESRNQVYQSGSDFYSYYTRGAECFLGNGVYFVVSCDTATGEVMEVSVGAGAEEEFVRALLLAACALEPERDRNEVWREIEELFLLMEGEEYYIEDWGIHEIYLSGGTSYYGSLNCLPEYDKYQ
ncbi:MAG: hypothetical protein HFI66_07255 [Lachnospiraceae bacterium]|jgi:hypothetical protein|nr:hypothetical protein [Lachnospiraceae bacterium]